MAIIISGEAALITCADSARWRGGWHGCTLQGLAELRAGLGVARWPIMFRVGAETGSEEALHKHIRVLHAVFFKLLQLASYNIHRVPCTVVVSNGAVSQS